MPLTGACSVLGPGRSSMSITHNSVDLVLIQELHVTLFSSLCTAEEDNMGFGRGALLWLLGIPLPIILLLALFWHH
jgi:hypothetical protein